MRTPPHLLGLVALFASFSAQVIATDLGIKDTQFTLNGAPTFLLGISYYGALGASEDFIRRDLDDMQRYGFNWIRVWATWDFFGNDVSALDDEGSPREPFLGKLQWLVAECDRRGIVVDVTLSRGDGKTGTGRLKTLAAHRRAVETLVAALKPYRNCYLDLANERNCRDGRFVSFAELNQLRDTAKRLDSQRLVTASGDDISRKDLQEYLRTAQVDFITPHRTRHPKSHAQTEAKAREHLAWMKEIGRAVPVHYQEPLRRGYFEFWRKPLWQPTAEAFLTDLSQAQAGGAAGWCFHNGPQDDQADGKPRRSFDLRDQRLFEQFDAEERKILQGIRASSPPSAGKAALRLEPAASPAAGPLRPHPTNPRYFTDGTGKAVYLTGSHTWGNLQDRAPTHPPAVFDYDGYLDFLQKHHHNFMRMWAFENTHTKGAPEGGSRLTADGYNRPQPYERTGLGLANDGGLKFDLTRLNQAYFDRLRARVLAARDRGIYVSVMLFQGWSVWNYNPKRDIFTYHPFNRHNNVNGIDGDLNGNGEGEEVHSLQVPAITALQEAYVRKVIDTVNDLDNVLYEVSNEDDLSEADTQWQYHLIRFIQHYEASKPRQHPVGMTGNGWSKGNARLFASPADWVSPGDDWPYKNRPYRTGPPAADGRKVVLLDTDHLGPGHFEDDAALSRVWVWKAFTRGYNPILMEHHQTNPMGDGRAGFVADREAMGHTRRYAERMNLAAMTPRNDLASSGYCLAAPGCEYLVYLPDGGAVAVDLDAVNGLLTVEWMHPVEGKLTPGEATAGGARREFKAPFVGDAVLYIATRKQSP